MKQLERQAAAEGLSKNALVIKALELYLTKDITDESLLIAKMSDIQRVIRLVEKKMDISQKLDIDFYQHFFLFQPDMPGSKAEAALLYKRAAEKTDRMINGFRERLSRAPALIESLLADFLEEEIEEEAG
jgi:hypothetical protein